MAKEKVTLTLDAKNLAAFQSFVDQRSLQASPAQPISEHVAQRHELVAVDDWLQELEAEHGPVPPETLDWAATVVDEWAKRTRRRKAG